MTADLGPHEVDAPETLFRVARAEQPLRFSQISPADVPLPKAGNRFDVPGGGILYCATDAVGCYAEVLARFRPSAAVRSAVQHEDPHFMLGGGVPASGAIAASRSSLLSMTRCRSSMSSTSRPPST